ncbi:MAG: cobalamin biosynthesis protein, partial [Butyrivibrio sp.]|nr:cobalamin biosynthesis protein [Butyrivibrio sp.]
MKKTGICFSKRGIGIIEKINNECSAKGAEPVEGYISSSEISDIPDGFQRAESVFEWTKEMFIPGNVLIFVGATGIAVRALSGLPKDKLSDCPVIVIDEGGNFVIPLLSGHAGGANKIAATLSGILGATAVITTATDVIETFSADSFAVENNLTIENKAGIKQVSVKALEEKKVTLSIKNYPPKEKIDLLVSDEADCEYRLWLKPKPYVIGIGMKKGKDSSEAEKFLLEVLEKEKIDVKDIYALATIDIKEDEEALIYLRDKYRIPLIS